jgi:DNA (cytosine-5)-methyltransferase 1
MMRDGKLYQLPRWEHRINETDSGLWPTPTVHGNYNRKGVSKTSGDGLATAVKKFPTPAARDWKDGNYPSERARNTPPLAVHAGGTLNPEWVEWLMGWPIGWTDLKPLAMGRYQLWLRLHLGY